MDSAAGAGYVTQPLPSFLFSFLLFIICLVLVVVVAVEIFK
jgi:hypothetical protein